MRSVLFVLFLTGACAHHSGTGPQPVNVAAVRNEISGTIRSENGDRTIHSMGKVRADAAIVYTTSTSGEKLEEVWVKTDGRWKLRTKVALKSAE